MFSLMSPIFLNLSRTISTVGPAEFPLFSNTSNDALICPSCRFKFSFNSSKTARPAGCIIQSKSFAASFCSSFGSCHAFLAINLSNRGLTALFIITGKFGLMNDRKPRAKHVNTLIAMKVHKATNTYLGGLQGNFRLIVSQV